MKAPLVLVLALALASSAYAWKCNQPNGRCVDKNHVCLGGFKYECQEKEDCACKGKWPCHKDCACGGDEKRNNGGHCSEKNWVCTSSTHFCLDHIKMACAPGTWCKTTNNPHITPCNLTKPPKCECEEKGCIDDNTYCKDGKKYHCDHGFTCKDKRCVKEE